MTCLLPLCYLRRLQSGKRHIIYVISAEYAPEWILHRARLGLRSSPCRFLSLLSGMAETARPAAGVGDFFHRRARHGGALSQAPLLRLLPPQRAPLPLPPWAW